MRSSHYLKLSISLFLFTVFSLAMIGIAVSGNPSAFAQDDATATPTEFTPIIIQGEGGLVTERATLTPEEYELPSYQSAAEALRVNEATSGVLSAEQMRYVYSYVGQPGANLEIEFSADSSKAGIQDIYLDKDFTQYNYLVFDADTADGGSISTGLNYSFTEVTPLWIVVYNMSGRDLSYTITTKMTVTPVLTYGETVTAMLGTDAATGENIWLMAYDFQGQMGDIINVTINSEADTRAMILYHGRGQLIEDTHGGIGFNPEIYHFQLPEDNTYHLEIMLENPSLAWEGEVFPVEISLTETTYPVLPLDDFAFPRKFNGQEGDTFVFAAEEGQAFNLDIRSTELHTPATIIVRQGDQELEQIIVPIVDPTITGFEIFNHTLSFTVPAEGEVRVIVLHNTRTDDSLAQNESLRLTLHQQ